MEVAPRHKLLTQLILSTLLTWLTLFALLKLLYTAKTFACMPIYIVRKGLNARGMGCSTFEQKMLSALCLALAKNDIISLLAHCLLVL